VDAIKRFRAVAGAGLAEAVDRVERIEDELRAAMPEKFTARPKAAPRRMVFRVVFVLAALLLVVVVLTALGGLIALLLQFVSHSTK
jgi:ferric-dicitrate binding protein FerR (iron transport regulator)